MLRISGCGLSSWLFQLFFRSLFVVVVSRQFQMVGRGRRSRGQTMYYFHSSAIANMISSIAPSPSIKMKEMKEMFTFMMFASIQTEHLSFFQYTHTLLLERNLYIYIPIYVIYLFISFFHWVAKDSSLQATDFLLLLIFYLYIHIFLCVMLLCFICNNSNEKW